MKKRNLAIHSKKVSRQHGPDPSVNTMVNAAATAAAITASTSDTNHTPSMTSPPPNSTPNLQTHQSPVVYTSPLVGAQTPTHQEGKRLHSQMAASDESYISSSGPLTHKDLSLDIVIRIFDFLVFPLQRYFHEIFFDTVDSYYPMVQNLNWNLVTNNTMITFVPNINVGTVIGAGIAQLQQLSQSMSLTNASGNTPGGSYGSGNAYGGPGSMGGAIGPNGLYASSFTDYLSAQNFTFFNQLIKHENSNEKRVKELESKIIKFLYGAMGKRKEISKEENKDSPLDAKKRKIEFTPRQCHFLWKNIDFSVRSYFLQDHEVLTSQQLILFCKMVHSCSWLNFTGEQQFSDECLDIVVQRNPNLKYIDVTNTKVDYSGVKNVLLHKKVGTSLRALKISWLLRTQFNNSNVSVFVERNKLFSRNNLQQLELVNNNLHAEGVLVLLQNLPNLKVLNLSHNIIKDDACLNFLKYPNLQELYLVECEINDMGAGELISGTISSQRSTTENVIDENSRLKLKVLDLSKNRITERAFENLPQNTSLITLKATDTLIHNTHYISKNTSIQNLFLDYTRINNENLLNLLVAHSHVPNPVTAPPVPPPGTAPAASTATTATTAPATTTAVPATATADPKLNAVKTEGTPEAKAEESSTATAAPPAPIVPPSHLSPQQQQAYITLQQALSTITLSNYSYEVQMPQLVHCSLKHCQLTRDGIHAVKHFLAGKLEKLKIAFD